VRNQTVPLNGANKASARQRAVVAFIGAGNYASAALIPAFARTNAKLKLVASRTGVSGRHVGKKFGFEETTTATERVFADNEINTVVIATRHDSHARLVCTALEAGKHVFVEKPLAIDTAGLEAIKQTYSALTARGAAPLLMVGFNRRFAPHVVKIRSLLEGVKEPKVFVMTVNAGMIPESHWTQDPAVGGGRVIGEACHFIDLLRFLAGAPVTRLNVSAIGRTLGMSLINDKVSFTMQFADGSMGTVHYLANGHKSFPKERLEIFCGGRILQLDNFRRLTAYGWPGFTPRRLWRQDKGNNDCAAAFVRAVENGVDAPIPIEEIIEVTAVSFQIEEQVRA
jgi:predicted dehydrogenase